MRDFEFSAGWQRQLFPRRGSVGAGAFSRASGARTALDGQLGGLRADFEAAIDPELGRAAVRWLDGAPDATPLGAAVAAAPALNRWDMDWRKAPFVDVWIAERGLDFAARAVVELMTLTLEGHEARHVRRMPPGEGRSNWWNAPHLYYVLRVRAALAVAPDDEYARVVGLLAEYRSGHEYQRLATTLLAPEQPGWVEEDIAAVVTGIDVYRAFALSQAVTDRAQLDRLDTAFSARWSYRWMVTESHGLVATLVDGLGPDALGWLLRVLDDEHLDSDRRRRLPAVIAQFPTDEAMRALIERADVKYVPQALQEMSERFPERAVRLLAQAPPTERRSEALRAHVLNHRDLAVEVLAGLSGVAADRVRALLDEAGSVTEAPVENLPPLLVSPPWHNRVKVARPVVVTGLVCADGPSVTWRAGEREAFAELPREYNGFRSEPEDGVENWDERAVQIGSGRGYWYDDLAFFLQGPDELARPLLATWTPGEYAEIREVAPLAARFGVEALPALIRRAASTVSEMRSVLLPFSSPELAVLMADWMARLKSARGLAAAWFLRHPAEASRALVPPALGKAGPGRRQAENALTFLSARGHGDKVRAAAESYGPAALSAIETLLERDPLTVLPAKVPTAPVWASPALLPPVRVRDGSGVLPLSSVEHLVTVFALSRMDQPYAGLDVVREVVNPGDLAGFTWALFDRWYASGADAKENWALDALALAGDDEAVRRLTPLILAWPGEGGHARAVTGVNVLAGIGTDVALMHLHTIAQRAKFKGLKSKAQEKMASVAGELGLTAEQLADRLVPTLGLDDDGSLRLDYGSRQFVVGFDEQLRPYVLDGTGKRLKALPRPGTKDDDELAPAAYQQFSALKKDVRRIASDVIVRLETAMVTGRRWNGTEFRELFVGHPLLRHIVRRLVWGVYDGDTVSALRVAEDLTFADVDDESVALADDAVVGVAHPLHLGDTVKAWAEMFADYEILQPFPQLARPVFTLAEGRGVEQFEGRTVPAAKLLGLERRGWHRDDPMDAGVQGSIEVVFASGIGCVISLSPGLIVGEPTYWEDQVLDSVHLDDRDGQVSDPVAVSEILRDLTDVIGNA